MRQHDLERRRKRKRVTDLLLVVGTLPLTIPLALVVALTVRLRLGHPTLFKQERSGHLGVTFKLYKFRSMTDERDALGALLPDAQRLTHFGALMRRTSLDELPQLVNVLKGDMSLVGPRPLYPEYAPHYSMAERRRHDVLPGITGWAQVSGRNLLGWDDRLQRDVEYVSGAQSPTDMRIVSRTVAQAIRREGVAVDATTTGQRLDVARSGAVDRGLRLRRLEFGDLELRVLWMSDPRISQLMKLPRDVSVATSRDWLAGARKNGDRQDFALERVKAGEVVAMTGLRQSGPKSGEACFYVFVDPQQHHGGLGRTATMLTCAWAFSHGGYHSVVLSVDSLNLPALRIYGALGFAAAECSPAERIVMGITAEEWARRGPS